MASRTHVPELIADPQCELALAAEAMRNYTKFLSRALNPADLTNPTAITVIEACASVYERGEAVNITGVATELQRIGRIQSVGLNKGLLDVATTEVPPDHERVATLAALRRIKESGVEMIGAAHAGDLARAMDAAQQAERNALGQGRRRSRPLHEAVRDLRDGMRENPTVQRRVHPGMQNMHEALGNLPVGAMVVIGADSNVGKSGFVLEMLIAAVQRNVRVGLISVEDPDDVTAARALGAFAGVSSRNIQRNRINTADAEAMERAYHDIVGMGERFQIADCTGCSELDVCAEMTYQASKGAKIIAVDYLTEIEASKPQKDRRNEIRWISKRLKTHAKRLGVVLVLVSQLARPYDKTTNKIPSKHDLKESGDVTNQAEVILLLWREEESDVSPVKCWVAKCKWGGVGQWWELERKENGRLVEVPFISKRLERNKKPAPARANDGE